MPIKTKNKCCFQALVSNLFRRVFPLTKQENTYLTAIIILIVVGFVKV